MVAECLGSLVVNPATTKIWPLPLTASVYPFIRPFDEVKSVRETSHVDADPFFDRALKCSIQA